MASYRNKLPASGGGQAPSFQRGVYIWATSTATPVTIPITQVDPSKSFITHISASTGAEGKWNEVTFTAILNADGNGIKLFRGGTISRTLYISWEVCTDQSVSVQRGAQLFLDDLTFNITLPAISDLSKASARLVGTSQSFSTNTSDTLWGLMVRCELSASSIKLTRNANGYTQVSWEVIRYV